MRILNVTNLKLKESFQGLLRVCCKHPFYVLLHSLPCYFLLSCVCFGSQHTLAKPIHCIRSEKICLWIWVCTAKRLLWKRTRWKLEVIDWCQQIRPTFFLFYFIMWSLFCCFLEPTTWKHADSLPGTRCDMNPARKHIVCKSLYNKSLTKEKKINGAVLSVCYISYTQLMYHYWLSEDQM